ncbi:unnamed protein product [Adineta steineri]|uniref:Protein disulfide-isomerase n=2 Tax=Adineta steineri TaxID=433720 RepID=A0A813RJ56_9BILA|nr:unnamed protein product [Adineta steineri]
MQLIFSFLIFPIFLIGYTYSISFTLPVSTRKCLKEEVHKDTMVTGDYDITSLPGLSTHLEVKDTKGHILYNKEDATKGRFAFTTEDFDIFDICVETKLPHGQQKHHLSPQHSTKEVTIKIKHGVETKDYEALAKANNLKPLEVELNRLEDLTTSIVSDFAYMKQREEEMRTTNESTNNKVLYFSIFSMCCLMSLALWQVLYLLHCRMRSILLLTFFFLLTWAVDDFSTADDDNAILSGPNIVVDLSKDNFTQYIQQNPVVLVEFYAPWCGHCKQLAPFYEQAARLMKDEENPVAFAKIDATIEQSLAMEYSIEGYPTLKIFHKNSQKPVDYDGPRQPASAIADFMKTFADPTWTPPPSDVIELTQENFEKFTTDEELTLVEFYAPWCGHCKRLEPKFEKAATLLKKDTNIRLAKVDSTVETELATSHNITGYPTLFVYRKGGKRIRYDGEQTEHGIVSTMKELLSLPSREIRNMNDYKNLFRKNDQPVIIGVFQNDQDHLYQLFIDYAYTKRKVFQFGHTFEKFSVFDDVQSPAIVLQHHSDVRSKYEKEKFIFNKHNANENDFELFIEQYQIPLVGILTEENQRNIYLSRRPICVVMYDLDFSFEHRERTQYWRNKILNVANNYKDKYTFAVADEEKMSGLLKEFALEESAEDVNVGCFDKNGLKYRMDDDDEFTSESFEEFVSKLIKGKVKPYFKSQPIPKQSVTNGIHTVVAKNFEKIVKDKTKNAVVFFYAPWCGHCTNFKPTYMKLAQRYTSQSNLILTQIDASANDIPSGFEVTGFPTIYFVPMNNQPVKYEGNRDINDLVNFIDKNLQSKSEL